MNTVFAATDLLTALAYSSMAYFVGTAYNFRSDPRWSAEQLHANRQTWRACCLMMALAAASGLVLIPIAILTVPFWEGPWWGDVAVAMSIALTAAYFLLRRSMRDVRVQRFRLIG